MGNFGTAVRVTHTRAHCVQTCTNSCVLSAASCWILNTATLCLNWSCREIGNSRFAPRDIFLQVLFVTCFPVGKAGGVLSWWKEKACICGRYLRLYRVSESVQPIWGGPKAWSCNVTLGAWSERYFASEWSGLEICGWECEVCECVRVVTELAEYRLGSARVQEAIWDKGGTEQCFCVWKQEQKTSARDVNFCTLQEHTNR